MRPPLASRRAAARRLAEQVRRRLEPVERVLPVRLPGSKRATPGAAGAVPPAGGRGPTPAPEEVAARIDAARERLRATIEPPEDRSAADEEPPT